MNESLKTTGEKLISLEDLENTLKTSFLTMISECRQNYPEYFSILSEGKFDTVINYINKTAKDQGLSFGSLLPVEDIKSSLEISRIMIDSEENLNIEEDPRLKQILDFYIQRYLLNRMTAANSLNDFQRSYKQRLLQLKSSSNA